MIERMTNKKKKKKRKKSAETNVASLVESRYFDFAYLE